MQFRQEMSNMETGNDQQLPDQFEATLDETHRLTCSRLFYTIQPEKLCSVERVIPTYATVNVVCFLGVGWQKRE